MKIGYVVGFMGPSDLMPDFSSTAHDGRKDAETEAQKGNDRFPMLHHKVYELHELEDAQ
jgi:hypothetical protein